MTYSPRNPNGQATMANSTPVVIASDQTVIATSAKQDTIIGHVDGIESLLTTIDSDTSGILTAVQLLDNAISGNNMQVIAGAAATQTYNVAGVITINTVLLTLDLSQYTGVSIQCTSMGTTGVVTPEWSNDNSTWVTATIFTPAGATATTFNAAGLWNIQKQARYLRLRLSTATTAGTTTIYTEAYTGTPEPFFATQVVSGSGNFAVTMAANATTTPAKAQDGAAGATDTGIPTLMVRRDTPTALTPVAGDYAFPQLSANGEQWVRLAGELADDSAFTVATTRVIPAGFLADETATDSVDEGDAGAARITLDRKQIIANYAHTAGGATPYKLISAATTNATSVKASAGQVYSIVCTNTNAAVRYLKLYNKASAPTVGTDTPVQVYAIPGATTGGGFTLSIPVGMTFGTGIALATTTGAADSDTAAVAANEIIINLTYL